MRVLITGVTGFAGRHLAAHCAERGHEVHGLVRPARDGAGPHVARAHAADLTDSAALSAVLEAARPDRVAHLAGASSVGQSFGAPVETWEVNLGGTLALLEAVRRAAPDTPVLVVTSGEVYGRVAAEDLPVRPDTALVPLSPYGASKAAADLAAAQYREGYGMRVTRVRAFNQIGPGQDPRFVLPNAARQIARAEHEERDAVEVRMGNVETRRDFTDVRDMVRAYRLLLEHPEPGPLYLACSGRSHSIRELVEGLAPLARIPVTISSDSGLRRSGEQPDLYGTPEALTLDTGWSPAIPLSTTLRDTLEHWRARVRDEES